MKSFIVTGASKGIGLSVTQILLNNGANVLGVGRSNPTMASIAELLARFPTFRYLQLDLSQPGSGATIHSEFIKHFEDIDGIVLNAGVIQPITTIASANLDEWKRLMDINVFSQMELLQKCITSLRKQKGSVVFVSSGASTEGYAGWGPYCVSKGAFNLICGSLSKEEPDITAVSIRPGVVDTEMQQVIRTEGADAMPTSFYDKFVGLKKNNQLLDPSQPGKAIASLCLHPDHELSGHYVQWDSIDVSKVK
jgi:NAD(P)-dependent dehydrogenase (short-subunit alcohol dehydrogenase family)